MYQVGPGQTKGDAMNSIIANDASFGTSRPGVDRARGGDARRPAMSHRGIQRPAEISVHEKMDALYREITRVYVNHARLTA